MKYKGYMGQILRVNLSTGKVSKQELTDELARMYLGPNGFAARILYDELKPGIDPLSPENKMFFGAGPLVGTGLPFTARTYLATKSPLTGIWGDSTAGGYWATALKRAGYDALIVEGKAEKPVYVSITDGDVEIKSAEHLRGLTTYKTEDAIKAELGKGTHLLCIGPGGENLVKYACIMTDSKFLGRTGVGAAMGSKNLKAIAVKGSAIPEVADRQGLKRYITEIAHEKYPGSGLDKGIGSRGTQFLAGLFNNKGLLGRRNWQSLVFEPADKWYETLQKYLVGTHSCYGCVAHCTHEFKVTEGPYKGAWSSGVEWETLFALGSNCYNSDVSSIVKMNNMCGSYGLDTISTGVTLAFAMECHEKGLIRKGQMDGIDLRFGNPEAMVSMIDEIAQRKGFGDILAEGTRRAAKIIGKGAEKFAMHVKGLEIPAYGPRAMKGMALGYAVGSRGASHHDGRPFDHNPNPALNYDGNMEAYKGKGRIQSIISHWTACLDCMGFCHFAGFMTGEYLSEGYVEQANLVTGMGLTLRDLWDIGERAYTLERAFNVREGIRRKDDTVPERFLTEPVPDGPHKGAILKKEELDEMLDEFYEDYGWDKATGVPTKERWQKLGFSMEDYPV